MKDTETRLLEAEIQQLADDIQAASDEPLLSERAQRLSNQLDSLENTRDGLQRVADVLNGEINSMRAFAARAPSYRDALVFSSDRLQRACEGSCANDLTSLVAIDKAIVATTWWLTNADAKVEVKKGQILKQEKAIQKAEAAASPVRSELAGYRAKLKAIRSKREAAQTRDWNEPNIISA